MIHAILERHVLAAKSGRLHRRHADPAAPRTYLDVEDPELDLLVFEEPEELDVSCVLG